MAQKREPYAKRLSEDKEARKQIAILRMGGVPLTKIAEITKRNLRTISEEVRRPEHKKLIQRYVVSVGKKTLPADAQAVIEKALDEKASANK